MVSINIVKNDKIVCAIYTAAGEYGKPFLYITSNGSRFKYFVEVAYKFERRINSIGMQPLACTFTPQSRMFRMPDDSWWNEKEKRWYNKDEYTDMLNTIFSEIKAEIEAA